MAVLPLHRAHLHGVIGLLLQLCIQLVDGSAQCLIGLIQRVHRAALIIGQRGQRLAFAAVLHRLQASGEIVQRSLCSQHLGAVCTKSIGGSGQNIRRRILPGGQLLAQVITVVGGDPCGEPLTGSVVLAAQLGAAKAEKSGQHHHHAQGQRRRPGGKRSGQLCFQCGQLLLARGQRSL